MTIKFNINAQEITAEEGQTVLEAARQNAITIPTLCYQIVPRRIMPFAR
jgi:NADH dehydrogenase/NADH:ubiquinone oxidoreductase subunit G